MAHPARVFGSVEATASQISAARYICLTCRRQLIPYSPRIVVHHVQRLNSTDSQSWTDKLRPSFLKKDTSTSEPQREIAEGEQEAKTGVESPAPTKTEYVAASTWDGLRRVGFEPKSWEQEETREFEFEP